MTGPLEGLKVVDFSRVLAGPLCARTLADLGADVIKIEPPRPDVSRAAFPNRDGMSGYYAQQNSGKRNISIDLNAPGARDFVLRLCDDADIVVENFRAGTLKGFGLDYPTLAQRNPKLVYVSITGYGQHGPWASRMAYAPTVQAETGFTHNTLRHFDNASDGRKWTDPLSHADVYAGLQATIAVLAAVRKREVTGRGQYIDVAMAAVMLSINERAHLDLAGVDTGAEPGILGAADGPHFVGPGGEEFVAAQSIVGSHTFPNYLKAMRRMDLAHDPRFCTAEHRLRNYKALHAVIQTWMRSFRDLKTLDAQLDEAKIAIGQIRTLKELAETDWAKQWGAVHEISDRRGGSYLIHGYPWHFSDDELGMRSAPAFRGEHNEQVFREAGLADAEIRNAIDSGILVGGPPPSTKKIGAPVVSQARELQKVADDL
ncbi:CoA transferase [Paraburkholderia sp. JPY432]|uniref:CaiB/BaiF CoA transferase family protein n=1 Tax=Paraburkholderia youngii TaxID=2782701 RepID=UPI0015954EBC|nr:CoA transferase [Paraburkholderia youngii]NVH77291.1 CoA transferase [Paraburkholderia youngii]